LQDSYYKRQNLRSYLFLTGIFLAVTGGIQFHYAIVGVANLLIQNYLSNPVETPDILINIFQSYSNTEHIIGIVFLYVGLVALISILFLIGRVFDNERKKTTTTIVLLAIFIAFKAFTDFYPYFITWGYQNLMLWYYGWGGLVVIFIYAIFRGITFNGINKQLNVPRKGYGNKLFNVYAWSYLLTRISIFIIAIILKTTDNSNLITGSSKAGNWIMVSQFFIDALFFGITGLKFLLDSFNNPNVESKIAPRFAPAITTAVELGMGQYKRKGMKRPTILDESQEEEKEVLRYCTRCGAQNFKEKQYCDNCGQKLD